MTTPKNADPIAPRVTKPKTITFGTKDTATNKRGTTVVVPPLPTDEESRNAIRDKLVTWYVRLGKLAGKVNRHSLATALTEQSEPCADAWLRVAEKNANVRRLVFAINEGNAWFELAMAHMPILLATLPESALDRLMSQFTSALFSASTDDTVNGDSEPTA